MTSIFRSILPNCSLHRADEGAKLLVITARAAELIGSIDELGLSFRTDGALVGLTRGARSSHYHPTRWRPDGFRRAYRG
jgi:hypothetical protein